MKAINRKRRQIDNIDKKIVELLARRIAIAKQIGEKKRMLKIRISSEEREKEILQKVRMYSKKKKLNEKFVLNLYKKIINYSKKVQK